MTAAQAGILAPVPRQARYLTFEILPDGDAATALRKARSLVDGDDVVMGVGRSLALELGADIPGLRDFPARAIPGADVPATPAALWLWLRGDDRGVLLHKARKLQAALAGAFRLHQMIDAFQHGKSRDLTGYEDGTENPTGNDAIAVAISSDQGAGLDGGSFVAVQQWVHQLDYFERMSAAERDDVFGRRLSDNEEFDDAPAAAHTKRTAQESFSPPAFVVRRSMPWTDGMTAGLVFTAFGRSLDAFEALLNRMTGVEDGIVDKLFTFTRPVTGAYYWCPPMGADGHPDLTALGL